MATRAAQLTPKVKQVLGENFEAFWFKGHRAGRGAWMARALDQSKLERSDPRHYQLGYNLKEAHANLDKMIAAGGLAQDLVEEQLR